MEDKYNYQKGFELGETEGKKKALKLAIDIISIYDINCFTIKSFRREIIAHLKRDLKDIKAQKTTKPKKASGLNSSSKKDCFKCFNKDCNELPKDNICVTLYCNRRKRSPS